MNKPRKHYTAEEKVAILRRHLIRAQGLSKDEEFRAQNEAIGATSTTLVNIATVSAEKGAQFVPQIVAVGGGSAIDSLAATLTKVLAGQANVPSSPSPSAEAIQREMPEKLIMPSTGTRVVFGG